MKIILWLFVTCLTLYIALCVFVYLRQEALIFYPTQLPGDFQYTFAQPFSEVNLPVADAVINLVHFRGSAPKGVVLYLHGNGDIVAHLGWVADYFLGLGYDVIMPDYRGYGKSTGTISHEAELHDDMRIVYQYVQSHYTEPQITIYGQSLGSGLATRLAAEQKPARLILEAPYYSLQDLARIHLRWVPIFLLKYSLRTDQWVKQVTCPVYLIHGTADQLIPHTSSERLYQLIPGEKKLLTVTGAGHGLLLSSAQVRQFVGQILT
jgi:hypothetical protein